MCAFIGLYIAIPVSNALDADTWILSLAAGMFIYISLADIVSVIHIPDISELCQVGPLGFVWIDADQTQQ